MPGMGGRRKILSISQDYLTKFSSLEKWAQELEAMGWSEPQYRQWRMSNPGVGDLYQ